MPDDDLWRRDATDVARAVASGEVSAREVIDSNLARLDAVNPRINAVAVPQHDDARAAADAADRAQADGWPLGALHGVPVTIKINVDQAGYATDNGVVAFKDLIATEDAPIVAHLKAAGAIILGRSNSPAFAMRWFTGNELHGETRNPWDATRTPGGSSGGAAAAVAAGIGAIGHGNDIAGSIRYPAYCCGLAGLRPTLNRVPAYNASATMPFALGNQMMSVQGPIARRVADVALGFEAMAKPHPRDPRVGPVDAAALPPAPRRAAILARIDGLETDPAIAAVVESAGRALAAAGYDVEVVAPPELTHAASLWGRIAGPDTIALLEPVVEKHGEASIRRGLGFWRGRWPSTDGTDALAAYAERHRLLRDWSDFFQRYAVLVMPVSTMPPFAWDEDVRDQAAMDRIIAAQTPLLAISVLGLPGLSVPTGVVDGLPTGVQVVSAPYREDLCFAAGTIIEAACPMPTPIDPR
jgi:amidase